MQYITIIVCFTFWACATAELIPKFLVADKKDKQQKGVKHCYKYEAKLPAFESDEDFSGFLQFLESKGLHNEPIPTSYFWDNDNRQWKTRTMDSQYTCLVKPHIRRAIHFETEPKEKDICLYAYEGRPTFLSCKKKHQIVCQAVVPGEDLCKYEYMGPDLAKPTLQASQCKNNDRRLPVFFDDDDFLNFVAKLEEMGLTNTPVATGYYTTKYGAWKTHNKVKGGSRYTCYKKPLFTSSVPKPSPSRCLFVENAKLVMYPCTDPTPAVCQAEVYEGRCSGGSIKSSSSAFGSKAEEDHPEEIAHLTERPILQDMYVPPDAAPVLVAATVPPGGGPGDTVAVAYNYYYYGYY